MPVFVDIDNLIYAEDRDAGSKHILARDLVAELRLSIIDRHEG